MQRARSVVWCLLVAAAASHAALCTNADGSTRECTYYEKAKEAAAAGMEGLAVAGDAAAAHAKAAAAAGMEGVAVAGDAATAQAKAAMEAAAAAGGVAAPAKLQEAREAVALLQDVDMSRFSALQQKVVSGMQDASEAAASLKARLTNLTFALSEAVCADLNEPKLSCMLAFSLGPADCGSACEFRSSFLIGVKRDGASSALHVVLQVHDKSVVDKEISFNTLSDNLKLTREYVAMREGSQCLAVPVALFPKMCVTVANLVMGPAGTTFRLKLHLRDAILDSKLFQLLDRRFVLASDASGHTPFADTGALCGVASKPNECVKRVNCGWCTDGEVCLPRAPEGSSAARHDILGLCGGCGWFTSADLVGAGGGAVALMDACLGRDECGMCGQKECIEGDEIGATGSWDGCNRATWRFGTHTREALIAAPQARKDEL
mmetsp:Transcript_3581/g.8851  ORF Transcript_3581/g.8851 Transcript_3581/m.8851 type:complete len:434 (-) Transcript_3581:114-1415(-)